MFGGVLYFDVFGVGCEVGLLFGGELFGLFV